MWKWFVGIAVVLIVASLVITGEYETACETQKRQNEKDGASIHVPFVLPENNQPQNYAEQCKEEAPWWEKLVAWPDGVTALALILTLAAIAAQASLMKEHAEHFEGLARAASDNAGAAKDSAKAALMQAKHTETTERAWLLVNFVSMKDKELKEGEVAECHWAIKNVGGTPAVLLETKARFQAIRLHNEMPEDPVKLLPAIPDYGKAITVNERLLAPQDSIGYFTKWERNTDGKFCEFAFPVKDKDIWMVVAYGYVKYKDIFGTERESRSCDFAVIGINSRIIMGFSPHPNVPAAYNRCT
jgi:hypothetical protein